MNAPVRRSRWWRRPVLSLMLALCWLLLQQSVAPGDLLVAAALALLIPRVCDPLLGEPVSLRAGSVALRLSALVLWDIVKSNLTVALLVLNPMARPQPVWVRMPLRLQHPVGISMLASIITMTPGTVSCVVDEDRRELWVHALDSRSPEAMATEMAERYEAPLLEIFP